MRNYDFTKKNVKNIFDDTTAYMFIRLIKY